MRKRIFASILLLVPVFSGCASFPDAFAPSNDNGKTQTVAAHEPPPPTSTPSTPWLGRPVPADGKLPTTPALGTPKPIADEATLIYQPPPTDTGAPIDMLKRSSPTDH